MADLETRGQFWLPETPDQKVAGILRFTPGDGGRLELIGQLVDPNVSATPRIVGTVGSVGAVTLDNCLPISHMGFGTGLSEQVFLVGVIFSGLEYEPDEQPVFDEVVVELRHLFDWMGLDGLTETVAPGPGVFDLRVTALPKMTTELRSGVELTLGHTTGITGDRARRALTQGATVGLKFDAAQEYVDASRDVTNFQDFVSIATSHVAQIDSFNFFVPVETMTSSDGSAPRRRPFDLYVEWIAQEHSDKKIHANHVPIPFAAIGGIDGVVAWLRMARNHQPFISRVMATRYAKKMYADDRFFNRAAVLDGLRRQMAPNSEKHYADRLRALADVAGDPFVDLVGDVSRWVRRVVAERNDHAHHLGNAAQSTGAVRYYLADSAYWLFVLVLLRQCNYPQDVFDAVVSYQEFGWVRQGLAGII
jgi:hypothetical protein